MIFRPGARHVDLLGLREHRTDAENTENCRENKPPLRALKHSYSDGSLGGDLIIAHQLVNRL